MTVQPLNTMQANATGPEENTTPILARDPEPLPRRFRGLTVIIGRPASGKSTMLGQIVQQAKAAGQDTEVFRLGNNPGLGHHEFSRPGVLLSLTVRRPALIIVDDVVLANPTAPGDRSSMQVFKDLTTLGHAVVITGFRFRDLDLDAPVARTVQTFADRYLILDPPSTERNGQRDPHRPGNISTFTWKHRNEYLDWQPALRLGTIRPFDLTPNDLTGT